MPNDCAYLPSELQQMICNAAPLNDRLNIRLASRQLYDITHVKLAQNLFAMLITIALMLLVETTPGSSFELGGVFFIDCDFNTVYAAVMECLVVITATRQGQGVFDVIIYIPPTGSPEQFMEQFLDSTCVFDAYMEVLASYFNTSVIMGLNGQRIVNARMDMDISILIFVADSAQFCVYNASLTGTSART